MLKDKEKRGGTRIDKRLNHRDDQAKPTDHDPKKHDGALTQLSTKQGSFQS